MPKISTEIFQNPRLRPIIWLILISVIITGLIFLFIFIYYYNDPNYLSGVGQLAGALFSIWTVLGLIVGQLFQYRSMIMQSYSLQAQQTTLLAELDAVKASNLSLAAETLYNAIIRSQVTFERYARSIMITSPSLGFKEISALSTKIGIEISEYEFTSCIVNNDEILDSIKVDSSYGLTPIHIRSYIELYEKLKISSSRLSNESGGADIFTIIYDNTSVSQFYAFIKQLRV